jgi:DNA invertase Pin-like site-specific DNA recombinase
MMAAFSQFERAMIQERVRAGWRALAVRASALAVRLLAAKEAAIRAALAALGCPGVRVMYASGEGHGVGQFLAAG